ncbi:MAG TPA: molybdenum cofactor guanylyltransferase [Candidatus Dormibacteraeota bacterium]|nr:molybdenum cofactor guanylyltransferase [Candidatus Dormibacteraeota bacterium]
MPDGCSLLILAGGNSRRMGRDKGSLAAGSLTLIEHIARRLGPVVDEVLMSLAEPNPDAARLPVVVDRFPGMGPLAGMHAGLLAAHHPLVWVVACDLPDVEPALGPFLCGMADAVDAVVPVVDRDPEGVCAVYRRGLAPKVEALLRSGRRSVKSLLDEVDCRFVADEELRAVDPTLRSFRNLNTPAEYEAWVRRP